MRAKMHCDVVEDLKSGATPEAQAKWCETIRLSAVYGKDGSANAQWSKATPSGQVSLSITNPEAWGHFKQGGFYFVDFSEAPEDG